MWHIIIVCCTTVRSYNDDIGLFFSACVFSLGIDRIIYSNNNDYNSLVKCRVYVSLEVIRVLSLSLADTKNSQLQPYSNLYFFFIGFTYS